MNATGRPNGKKSWRKTAKYNDMKNFARRGIIRLLMIVETLNEFRTGKRCIAKAAFAWNLGIGYHRRVDDGAIVEFYLLPFTVVTITTFLPGYSMPNATANL